MSVRVKNIVAWMVSDVDRRLLPLMRGEADVRRIPFCGDQTAIYIETILRNLRIFYEHLQEQSTNDVEDTDGGASFLYEIPSETKFTFPRHSEKMERRIQFIFDQMTEEIGNMRARNLIRNNIKSYRKAETYINNPALIWKWNGAGRLMVQRIQNFLEQFKSEYLLRAKGIPIAATNPISSDYPFLTIEEQTFVAKFFKKKKRYPVWYIALCYFRHAKDRNSQTFARINGVLGEFEAMQALSVEYGLTFERVRQLSKMTAATPKDVPALWNSERWATEECFHKPLLTEANTHWAELCKQEQLGKLSFYAGLSILAIARPIGIIALMNNGATANGHRSKELPWQHPEVLFAYDLRLDVFRYTAFLKKLGHEANLWRIVEKRYSLSEIAKDYFKPGTDEGTRAEVLNILKQVIPLLSYLKIEGDEVVIVPNHLNYGQEIYEILKRRGEAMTIDEIHEEFLLLHPDDHHTDSSFIRSYMLADQRFEAVGRKSTYQLCEWQRFSGALGDLAVQLLMDAEEPWPMEKLSRKMLETRSNSTLKSCEATIYLAVIDGRLKYFFTEESTSTTSFVGLATRDYPERFWWSTLTVEGAIATMHRFIQENQRWPYSSRKTGIEGVLSYTLRKYTQKLHVTKEEYARYHQGMADIPPYQYPHYEREATFAARCQALRDFQEKHHRLPTNSEEPQLMKWYHETLNKQRKLDKFRKYHFKQIKPKKKARPAQQLSLGFMDE